MIQGQILVAGEWREAGGGETIAVVDPSDGAPFAALARGSAEDVDAAVRAAHAALAGEIFGPVLSALRFEGEEDAIRIANGTPYGLVAGVWTRNGARQLRLARALKSGQVFVNNYGAGGGVELPFGGMKGSGFGREKGFEALYGFSALKTVALHHG